MRRILALVLLAAVCSFPLTGCTKKSSPTSASSSGPSFTYPFLFNFGIPYCCGAPYDGSLTDVTGVAVSGNNIFVGDDYDWDIQVFDLNGNFVTWFYPYNSYESQDIQPEGLAADTHGNLYIADPYIGSVDIYNVHDFSVTTIAPGDTWDTYNFVWGDCSPQAVAVDAQGILYVADDGCDEIYEILQAGVTVSAQGQPIAGTDTGNPNINGGFIDSPNGIAVSPDGNHVYVADESANVILEYDHDMDYTGTIGDAAGASSTATGKFDEPTDVAVDNEGNVLVADIDNSRVQKFTAGGSYLTSLGNTEANFTSGQLSSPYYLTVDSSNNVYVTDNDLGTVLKYAPR